MAYVVGFLVALLVLLLTKIYRALLWRPHAIAKSFEKQGIKGPPYKFLYGSLQEMKRLKIEASDLVLDAHSNDIIRTAIPHYHKWSQEYGEMVLYWSGIEPTMTVTDPEMAKQILSNKFGFFVRPKTGPFIRKLMGEKGLIFVEGEEWVRHRGILNPAFSADKLKMMTNKMAKCTISMLNGWRNQAVEAENQCIEIEMSEEFKKLTSDIIAYTAFGSSYAEGQEAFKAQKELQKYVVAFHTDIFIPGSQYIPTPSNIRLWKLDRKLRKTLRSIVESRLKQVGKVSDDCFGDGSSEIIDETKGNPKLRMNEILENCKAFFFAGHETTSNLLTWAVFFLSLHQQWQERLREEVLNECGMEIPDADMLSKLKLVNMFLLEVLRLYCPIMKTFRMSTDDMKLENLMIPKGTNIEIPVLKVHRSEEYWGEDANDFKPLRFANGISKAANHPNAFLPFSIGPRNCIGQNFVMLEAKMVVSLILQRFSLSLSPKY